MFIINLEFENHIFGMMFLIEFNKYYSYIDVEQLQNYNFYNTFCQ